MKILSMLLLILTSTAQARTCENTIFPGLTDVSEDMRKDYSHSCCIISFGCTGAKDVGALQIHVWNTASQKYEILYRDNVEQLDTEAGLRSRYVSQMIKFRNADLCPKFDEQKDVQMFDQLCSK